MIYECLMCNKKLKAFTDKLFGNGCFCVECYKSFKEFKDYKQMWDTLMKHLAKEQYVDIYKNVLMNQGKKEGNHYIIMKMNKIGGLEK